ncbi:MAG: hypothetical protein RLQ12_14670 [Cyclobacteriaceae bacterium]
MKNYASSMLLVLFMFSCGSTKQSGCYQKDASSVTSDESFTTETSIATSSILEIKMCSFNIKFVGLYKRKDHAALADILKGYDLVLIQELVSPPTDGHYPDGTSYDADPEAKAFIDAMVSHGFEYRLSEEDSGTNEDIHSNSSSTEWFIVFYKPDMLLVDDQLITGFLADDRSDHPSYERVPYAFSFQTIDNGVDFTLISVHLKSGSGSADKVRRKGELEAIAQWIDTRDSIEKDYIIVGDMNIYTQAELMDLLPKGYRSLNAACLPTNLASSGKPYDHVMYHVDHTGSELAGSFEIVDLMEVMRPYWRETTPYPENDLNLFYQYYSDHKPVVFTLISDGSDDD